MHFYYFFITHKQTGRVCCFGGVVSLPRPLTSQKSPHRGEFGFSRQNELTPPPKGGGVGLFSNSGCLGLLDSSTAGSHRFNGAGNPFRWCRSPTWPPKANTGPHRAEFGFCLLAGASQEDHPPFRQSRIRTQAEEKTPLPCFSKIEPVKFVIPCKRFSKPPGENPFSLFMQRRFCAATGGPQDVCSTVFSYTNSGPGLSMAGS